MAFSGKTTKLLPLVIWSLGKALEDQPPVSIEYYDKIRVQGL